MSNVTHKTQVGTLDGTPVKRMFWSIVADYDLTTGLCELIDNALDLWRRSGQQQPLRVDVTLDVRSQVITVTDNAGGVRRDELGLLITPGGSLNDPNAELIGIFGVGSKRASIAVGRLVRIRTRYKSTDPFEVEIDEQWLGSGDWTLAYFQIPQLRKATTQVEISHLRKPLTAGDVEAISAHLGETYAWFIRQGCTLLVNETNIAPIEFDHWAFPKGYPPQRARFDPEVASGSTLAVEITGGLIYDRDGEQENYGVYFYCNDRLIVKELRQREVGYFIGAEAGVPHPDASLCRVIVRMNGPAQQMPWNSSKSGIHYGHPAFQVVRPTLIQLASHYSSLSRRMKGSWGRKVFPRKIGTIEEIVPIDPTVRHPLVLPPLPKVNKPQVEKLKARNKIQIQDMPWTLGLVEAMDAVNVITRQHYETKNRIALLLLDSNFEIALKEFIVHDDVNFPPSQFNKAVIEQLFKSRPQVIAAITQKIPLPKKLLSKAQHYYNIRNKLIHERATSEPTTTDVTTYASTVEKLLKILFGLSFPG